MSKTKAYYGLKLVFGVAEKPLNIIDLPPNCIRYRLKQRNSEYTQIFLLYNDGIEQSCVKDNQDGTYSPHILQKTNRRKLPTQYPSSLGKKYE